MTNKPLTTLKSGRTLFFSFLLIAQFISELLGQTVWAQPTLSTEYQQEIQQKAEEIEKNSIFFYNESAYLPQYSNMVNEGKLHYRLFSRSQLQPYLGLAFGQDLQSGSNLIYNDNHITPLLGARFNLTSMPVGFFSEARQNFRMINKPNTRPSTDFDFRLGTYGYQWFDISHLGVSRTFFQESYGELIFTSMLDSNIIFDGWAKQGVRQTFGHHFSLDGYLELQAGLDRLKVDYCNYIYPGFGVRAIARFSNISVQLMLRRPINVLSVPSFANSPWNSLFVFTGEI